MILISIPIISYILISIIRSETRILYLIVLTAAILNLEYLLYLYITFPKQGCIVIAQDLLISRTTIWLLLMVNTLMVIVYLLSYRSIARLATRFYLKTLISINILSIMVFISMNLLYFYISFETVLIPMFLIIGFYGSRNRKIKASMSLLIYTILFSLFFLISIIYIYSSLGSLSYHIIIAHEFPITIECFLWTAFALTFIVKVPLIPLHLWLPEAHVEAPTTGSVILAAILLKYGTYGLIRFNLLAFTKSSILLSTPIITASLISVIYASASALVLNDLKKIIAYSSIGHMGLTCLGIFSGNIYGLLGSYHFLISHAIVSSALFILIGIMYERYHTRTLFYYRGLVAVYPIYSIALFLATLGNISFPTTSSFISELFIYIGLFRQNALIAIISTSAILTSACYSLWLYHKMIFGRFTRYIPVIYTDLSVKEANILFFLLLSMMYLGLFPDHIFNDLIS